MNPIPTPPGWIMLPGVNLTGEIVEHAFNLSAYPILYIAPSSLANSPASEIHFAGGAVFYCSLPFSNVMEKLVERRA